MYAVAVPIYRTIPTEVELYSFLRLKQLEIENVVLFGPTDINIDSYRQWWPDIPFESFESRHFLSVDTYNRLMLSTGFYERFADRYEWLLIHQLDAFLFSDRIESFCKLAYDYFGAPWKEGQLMCPGTSNPRVLQLLGKRIYVGNGGLSLRKIPSTIDLLERRKSGARHWKMNEDGFFSYWGVRDRTFRGCPVEVASKFAFEADPEYWLRLNGGLAMGCHGFEKHSPDFYRAILKPIYSELLLLIPGLSRYFDDRDSATKACIL